MRTRYERRDQPIKPKSPFYRAKPRANRPSIALNLENLIEQFKVEMDSIDYSQSKTDNLTIGERKALSALMKRTDIVINKADKGSTIVVLDRNQYIKDGLTHLSNENVHKPLTRDITPDVKTKISITMETLYRTGMIDREMKDFCMPPKGYRTSQLYFLKTIHKNPMGIRPIVSSVNSVTENISQYVDSYMAPTNYEEPTLLHKRHHGVY